MGKIKKLMEVFPEWKTGKGIFDVLDDYDVPWASDDDDTLINALNLEYFGNISGEKYSSPLISKIMAGETLSDSERETLAGLIWSVNGPNWTKEYETLSFVYDPITNYDMEEVMSDDTTEHTFGHVNTREDDLTQERTPDLSVDTDANIYGFNSSDPVPTGNTSQGTSGTDTITNSGSQTNTESGTNTDVRNYTLTRKGNIGVMTSQQMVQAERDLWVWNYFRAIVFPAIDRVLTIQIY